MSCMLNYSFKDILVAYSFKLMIQIISFDVNKIQYVMFTDCLLQARDTLSSSALDWCCPLQIHVERTWKWWIALSTVSSKSPTWSALGAHYMDWSNSWAVLQRQLRCIHPVLLDRNCGYKCPTCVEDGSCQCLFGLLARECLLVLPRCAYKLHNFQLCLRYQLFGDNFFSKCKQPLHHWFIFVINHLGKWNLGSLDMDNSEHFTFFLHESQGSVRKYAKHPFFFLSTSRRGSIFWWISQNLSAILSSHICYLYCPSVNVLSLPCTQFWGIFHKTYRFPIQTEHNTDQICTEAGIQPSLGMAARGSACMHVYLCGCISTHFLYFVPAVKLTRSDLF